MHSYDFFLKKTTLLHILHSTPLHLPIQNILLAPNPFHVFFCKKLVGREINLLTSLLDVASVLFTVRKIVFIKMSHVRAFVIA